MRHVEAQFAEQARPARWLWILPVAGVAMSALLVVAGWRDRDALEAWRRTLDVTPQGVDAPTTSAANGQIPVYGASARHFLGERTALWPRALAAIERAQTSGVSVTSVDWTVGGGGIRIDLEAGDHLSVLVWLDKLSSISLGPNPVTLHWTLVRATEAAAQGVRAQVVGADGPPGR